MRKKLIDALRQELASSLAKDFPSVTDISNDPAFTEGHIGFKLGIAGRYSIFLGIVVGEDNDSFQANFAWNENEGYPSEPYRDMRQPPDFFLDQSAAEFQLASLSPQSVPWRWHLDEDFGQWKNRLESMMSRAAEGEAMDRALHSNILHQMPKRCSIVEGAASARKVAADIKSALVEYAKPFVAKLAKQQIQ
jgi:hypothetical protein